MNALKGFLIACLVTLGVATPTQKKAKTMRELRAGDAAIVDMSHALHFALVVVAVIVGAVVALAVLAALFPTYAGAIANISTNFTTTNWGNGTANSISPIFGLIVSLVGMFAVVGLALLAVSLYKHKGGKI